MARETGRTAVARSSLHPSHLFAALLRVAVLALGGIAVSCGGDDVGTSSPHPPEGWEAGLVAYRGRVHEFFATEQSPLDSTRLGSFPGLTYFAPDPRYRFVVRPDRSGAGEPVTLLDTKGGVRNYVVDSRIRLEKDGQEFALTLYRTPGSSDLFLPFRDATTGKETYEVGRYLELPPGPEGLLIVDFNYAKNPYCAYSDRWACPLVPEENHVSVAIQAGEKKYSEPH